MLRELRMINFSAVSNETAIGRMLRAPLSMLPKNLRVPVVQGPLRGARWIVGAHTHGCWLGTYEFEKQQSFAKHLRPNDVVFDVGAQTGFYTMLASRTAQVVVSFEPLPRNLLLLREHVRINRAANVTILATAVGSKPGSARFASQGTHAAGKLASDGEISVQVTSIDAVVGSNAVPPPSVIKMDIEGGELEALHGARDTLTKYRPTLFLSTHSDELRTACLSELRALGYRVSPIGDAPEALSDEFFCRVEH